jgi:hypothetical protein
MRELRIEFIGKNIVLTIVVLSSFEAEMYECSSASHGVFLLKGLTIFGQIRKKLAETGKNLPESGFYRRV